jgi:hypothetical protein
MDSWNAVMYSPERMAMECTTWYFEANDEEMRRGENA